MFFNEVTFKPEEVIDYLRKSQSDDPNLTVEEVLQKHETILDDWSMRHMGALVPEENKFREVVSGETLKERPEIQKVMRLIESPKYRAIKIVDCARLTRGDLEDIGRIMKLLKVTNTCVITPDYIYNLREEHDWDRFEMELQRGNYYLKYTKKVLLRGRLLSVSQGNYIGSIAPYGYDITEVVVDKRKCPTLKENKEQADVVRLIFDMYVHQNMGYTRIANTLDEMGVKAPKGKHWSPPSIKDMLSNVHYIGKVKWNWRKTQEIVEEGEIKKTRPKARIGEYLIYDGRHKAIISEELFEAAQAKKGKLPRTKAKNKVVNPFAGLIFCSCGRAMIYRTYKNNPPRLLCSGQTHCKSGSCYYEEMIDEVCDVLKRCISDFEVRLKNDEGNSLKLHTRLVKNLEKRLEELQAQELSQWEMQSHPDEAQRMPPDIFKMLNEKLLKEKAEVTQALCKARESMPEPIDYEEKIMHFKDALDALRDDNVSAEDKNIFLKSCIERITYKREKPERTRGVKGKDNGLKRGGNWTTKPMELDVKLKG